MPISRLARRLHRWWDRSADRTQPTRALRTRALGVEPLEDRSVPATTITIADATVVEPSAGGSVDLVFTATRTGGDQSQELAVYYTTVPGTAQPNVNFTPVTGVTTFERGSATARIAVPVLGDGVYNYTARTVGVQITGIAGPLGRAFEPQQVFATDLRPFSVALGDINADGRADIVASSLSGNASVLLNTTAPGATASSFAPQQVLAAGASATAVVLADVSGDGLPDLIVNDEVNNTVSVLVNTTAPGAAAASFAAPQVLTVGTQPGAIAVGDVNGDGRADLVVANFRDGTVSVLLNTTTGGSTSFAAQQPFVAGSGTMSVALGDVNGDGTADIVTANGFDGTISVLVNATVPGDTDCSFASQTIALGAPPTAVALGDINSDGRLDIVAVGGSTNTISVLLNTTLGATPSFAAAQQFHSDVNQPRGLALGDIDGDGLVDVVTAGAELRAAVLTNATAPGAPAVTFGFRRNFPVGNAPDGVALGDVNGDGFLDVVTANSSSDDVSVLVNSPVSIARDTATGVITESPDVFLFGTAGADELSVVRTPGGAVGSITFTLNGVTKALTGVTSFTFNGLDGNDTFLVSKVNGGPLLPGLFRFDGGTGANTLIVDADGASTQSVTGVVTFGDPQNVAYANVAQININNAATMGAFAAPNTADRATAFVGLSGDERYVQTLYLGILGRAGSRDELVPWVAGLAAPAGARAVADAIAHSTEARDRLVRSWYAGFLERPAQNGEHAGFVAALLAGESEVGVLGRLLGSPEFYARAQALIPSGSADERYVQALYQALLNRTGSGPEVDNFVRALPAVGGTGVARAVLNSAEFRRYQIEGYYTALLHRPSDASGLEAWAASGLDLSAVLVRFVSQPEFVTQG